MLVGYRALYKNEIWIDARIKYVQLKNYGFFDLSHLACRDRQFDFICANYVQVDFIIANNNFSVILVVFDKVFFIAAQSNLISDVTYSRIRLEV